MKNTNKIFRFTVIIAVIALISLLMTGCPPDDEDSSSSSSSSSSPSLPTYIITGSQTEGYTLTLSGYPPYTHTDISKIIDTIRSAADGKDCAIRFGDGTNVLDIGTNRMDFSNGSYNKWGAIKLTGKLKSSQSAQSYGVITIGNLVSVTSSANIENTQAFVPGNPAVAVRNSGTLVITGGAVTAKDTAVDNHNMLTVSGGTITSDTSNAVANVSSNTVKISGGTINSNSFSAVSNASTGKVAVSGTATITSANTSTTSGTISISSTSTGATSGLEMTGGTVTNTSETTGNAIFNNSATATVKITGGKVSKAGDGNYAIYNNSTGVVTITGATIEGNNYGVTP
jgi:hypothetical protein